MESLKINKIVKGLARYLGEDILQVLNTVVYQMIREVIGKCIMTFVKEDVKKGARNMQLCSGH